jgi:hypothetical protein
MNDDSGDQFPGAVPATTPATGRPTGADDRLVRMNAAYVQKVNAAVQADRENLAYELAEHTFPEEMSGSGTAPGAFPGRMSGRRSRGRGHRPPTTLGRIGRFPRRSPGRSDRSV